MRKFALIFRNTALPVLLLELVGCSDELGKSPYVPGKGYSCKVTISLTNDAAVGAWVSLQASRTTGPWVQIERSQVTNLAEAYPSAPPAFQTNVQAELTWQIDTPGVATFNFATLQSVGTNPFAREVMFNKPGVYRVWAINSYPTVATSEVHTIAIRARP
jgi:hypothetical protein